MDTENPVSSSGAVSENDLGPEQPTTIQEENSCSEVSRSDANPGHQSLLRKVTGETRFILMDAGCSTLIGFLVVSYWRGTWTLLDIWTCNQPGTAGMINGESFCFSGKLPSPYYLDVQLSSAWQTYLAGILLFPVGVVIIWNGWWQPAVREKRVTLFRATLRFLTVYILGAAAVCLWHGIWYFIDYGLLPTNPLASYWTSTVAGATLCYCLCAGASMLAPPAIFLMDGPGRLPPPIAVTILQSYRGVAQPAAKLKKEMDPLWLIAVDVFVSYLVLPWGVVGFWRGSWLLCDWYLWGFADEKELHLSMLYSFLISFACLIVASEDVVQHFPSDSQTHPFLLKLANNIFGRVRTLILAIGAVNFWRCVWYIWDEFLGLTYSWSAALSHLLGVFGLLTLGCVSCINAPASTLGVDCIAHPTCADEPLFHNVPVPLEVFYLFAIGRQPIGPPPRPPLDRSIRLRFMYQSSAHLDRLGREDSVLLNRRNKMKRKKSQFFRSR